jgi:hypothetical protein
MAQTSYSGSPSPGIPGQLADTAPKRVVTRNNENVSGISAGIFVKHGTAVNGADLLSLVTDAIDGIAIKSDAKPVDGLTGTQSVPAGFDFDCLEQGAAWMRSETGSQPTVGDEVFVRFVANGVGKLVVGAVRKDVDSGTARRVKGARALAIGTAPDGSKMSLVFFDKTVEAAAADPVFLAFSNASISATATQKLLNVPADKFFVVDEVQYDNITGLAADGTNYFTLSIDAGAQSTAKWSTLTGQQGALAADTVVSFTNDTQANRVAAPGTQLKYSATKTGTQTLPVGSGTIRGRFI